MNAEMQRFEGRRSGQLQKKEEAKRFLNG